MDINGNYIQSQFCSYEIALKLKELGFDEKCLGFWDVSQINNSCIELRYGMGIFKSTSIELSKYPKNVLAPLWQQCIDWFKEKHDIFVFIDMGKYYDSYEGAYPFQTWCKIYKHKELINSITVRNKLDNENFIFYSYEEAREQAILKAIELCQKKKRIN